LNQKILSLFIEHWSSVTGGIGHQQNIFLESNTLSLFIEHWWHRSPVGGCSWWMHWTDASVLCTQ
jgi:hypothetical protein